MGGKYMRKWGYVRFESAARVVGCECYVLTVQEAGVDGWLVFVHVETDAD